MGEGAGWAEGREREPDCHAVQQRGGAEQDQGHHERHPGGAGPAAEEGECQAFPWGLGPKEKPAGRAKSSPKNLVAFLVL